MITLPTTNIAINFWYCTMFDNGEMEWIGKQNTGMSVPSDLKRMMTDANALGVLSCAVVDAEEHSGTATFAMLRIRNDMRKTAVNDAIRNELTNRLNGRIANSTAAPDERPRPPLPYLQNSMRNARRHALQAAELALTSGATK